MPIDLPPVEAIPTPSSSQLAQQEHTAQGVTVRLGSSSYRVLGARQLGQQKVAQLAERSANAQQLIEALLQAYRHEGWTNVAVAALPAHTLWVIESSLVKIESPQPLQAHFEEFEDAGLIRFDAFARAARLADLQARRAGFDVHSTYLRDEKRPQDLTLKIKVTERRPSVWDYSLGLSDTGHRFLGRYFAGLGLSYSGLNGWRLGLSADAALPTWGGDQQAHYSYSFEPFLEWMTRRGSYKLAGRTQHYAYFGDGRGRRILREPDEQPQDDASGPLDDVLQPQPEDVLTPPERQARSSSLALRGEHMLYLQPNYSWYLKESISWHRDTLRAGQEPTQLDESYSAAALGVLLQWHEQARSWLPATELGFGVRQGLGGKIAGDAQDADARFTALNYQLQMQGAVAGPWQLHWRTSGNFAFSALPQQEEWVLGGFDRLNAWLPGVAVGDHGVLSQLRISRAVELGRALSLQAHAFAEYGSAAFKQFENQRLRLADVGLGFDLAWRQQWKLELRAAEPVFEDNQTPAERHEVDVFVRVRKDWDV